jgi:hypothetical protein
MNKQQLENMCKMILAGIHDDVRHSLRENQS